MVKVRVAGFSAWVATPRGDPGVWLPWSLSVGDTAELECPSAWPGQAQESGEKSEQQGMHCLEQNQLSNGPSEVSLSLLSFFPFSAHVQQQLDVGWSHVVQGDGW